MSTNNHPTPSQVQEALNALEGATSLDGFVEKAYLDIIRMALPPEMTRPDWLRKRAHASLHIDDSARDTISIYCVKGQNTGYFRFESGHNNGQDSTLIDFDRDTADRLKVIHGAIGAWLESDEAYIAYVDSL